MASDMRLLSMRGSFDAATRSHFSLFFRRVMATLNPGVEYVHNWHVDAISAYLMACMRGEVSRLVINMPPRMLKSTLVSVAWPAWLLGHDPAQRIMVACYAQHLSLKHSLDCRSVMQSEWYRRVFPHTVLSSDQNEKEKFATTMHGYRRAVSVGGAAIGEGGNILIIDDPINPLQASQRLSRDGVNDWFDHTWASRLDDKRCGVMLLVMQRLHAEDLSGYLLEKGGWGHLCLPAIAPSDAHYEMGTWRYARKAGEPLHAAREPLEVIERLKLDLGSANFSAQYQQAPLRQVGALVKREWFPRFDIHDEREWEHVVQSWDTGIKAGDVHDASACATFALVEGTHRLIDMLVVREEYPQLRKTIIRHAARFSSSAVLMEDKGSGQSLLQDLRRETALALIAIQPVADKITRLLRVTPMLEAGKVALPTHASWRAAFEQEMLSFPDGKHDDQVDAVSQYLNWALGRESLGKMRVRRV